MSNIILYGIFFFIIGSIFGSFYYVVGTRLPNNKSIVNPRSHCEHCQKALNAFDLIPVFSFLFLKGKCRYCHQKISSEYIIYEILTGILFLSSYLKFGFSYEMFVMLIISSLLVLIFITDFKYMIILDSPLLISGVLIIILKTVYFGYKETIYSLICGFLTFLTLLFIRQIGNMLFKKDSLGGGDIKFSFIIGMILGYKFSMISLILATFLAFPYAVAMVLLNKNSEVPFGPFLVSSLFLIFFFFEKFQYVIYWI